MLGVKMPAQNRPVQALVLFGPPGLPAEILNLLSRELLKAQASSDVRDALARIGLVSPVPATPEEETRRMERKLKEYTILINGNR